MFLFGIDLVYRKKKKLKRKLSSMVECVDLIGGPYFIEHYLYRCQLHNGYTYLHIKGVKLA